MFSAPPNDISFKTGPKPGVGAWFLDIGKVFVFINHWGIVYFVKMRNPKEPIKWCTEWRGGYQKPCPNHKNSSHNQTAKDCTMNITTGSPSLLRTKHLDTTLTNNAHTVQTPDKDLEVSDGALPPNKNAVVWVKFVSVWGRGSERLNQVLRVDFWKIVRCHETGNGERFQWRDTMNWPASLFYRNPASAQHGGLVHGVMNLSPPGFEKNSFVPRPC